MISRCVSTFQLASLLDQQLTQEDIDELRQAEALAKAFLAWDIGADEEDTMERLREILEDVEAEFKDKEKDAEGAQVQDVEERREVGPGDADQERLDGDDEMPGATENGGFP